MSPDPASARRQFYTAAIIHRHDLSIGARMTYAALDTYADIDGECRPTLTTLSLRIGKDRRSVTRWLAELESGQAISRAPGWQSQATIYRLLVSSPTTVPAEVDPDQMRLPGVGTSVHGARGMTPPEVGTPVSRGRDPSVPLTNQEQTRLNKPENKFTRSESIELEVVTPEVRSASAPDGAGVSSPDDHFAAFWSDYPHKVARGEAAKSLARALKRDGPDVIATGLAAWCDFWRLDRTEQRFIPYPTTWLNQSRYLDQPPTPRRSEPKGWAATRDFLEEMGAGLGGPAGDEPLP